MGPTDTQNHPGRPQQSALGSSYLNFAFEADWQKPAFSAQLAMAQSLRWMIDDFVIVDGRLIVKGWFISPFHSSDSARFLINEQDKVAASSLHATEEAIHRLMPDLPPNAFSRFQIDHPLLDEQLFTSLRFLPSGQMDDRSVETSAWYLLNQAKEDDPLPGGDNMYRVIANRDTLSFRLGGATIANRIAHYLAQVHGRALTDMGAVLDWGCGCGRVSRYLKKLGCRNLHGVDVDEANVAWCVGNLPEVAVQLSELQPPLPFPDAHFDLIIGISIFTHLREPTQFAWLEELARVLKPGGLAIVTVMSEGQIALQAGTAADIENVRSKGFVVTDDNDQLRLGEDAENYYVNVYHSKAYLYENWNKYLNIVEIVPFMGTHQDAVVLRRPQ